MNTEIYSLAECPGTKYSGDTITLKATPRDGIGPYYVAFKKNGIIIDPSRLGGQSNPITNATENLEITRTYTLNDEDVRNALTGTIGFSVFIRGSCPTGGGLQFDGVDDYVDAGNAASLNITNEITIEAWVKLNGTQATDNGIVSKWGAGLGYMLYAWPAGYITWQTDGLGDTTAAVAANSWNHIIGAFNGTNRLLYVNGILQSTKSATLSSTTQNLVVGRYQGGNYLNGTIDEVRIYNRALSPTEILGLYNGSTPRNGLVLEHIYSLGNANDLSGYDNNGTPINGPIFIPNACMDTCTVAIGCVAPVCNFVVT